jgi:hypothetical protein
MAALAEPTLAHFGCARGMVRAEVAFDGDRAATLAAP